jgi:hypothetical protein
VSFLNKTRLLRDAQSRVTGSELSFARHLDNNAIATDLEIKELARINQLSFSGSGGAQRTAI